MPSVHGMINTVNITMGENRNNGCGSESLGERQRSSRHSERHNAQVQADAVAMSAMPFTLTVLGNQVSCAEGI